MTNFFFNNNRGNLLTAPEIYDNIAIFQDYSNQNKIAFFSATNMIDLKKYLNLIKLHMGVKLKNLDYIYKFIKGLKIEDINPLTQNYQFALIKNYDIKPNHLTLLYLPPKDTFENTPLVTAKEKIKLFRWCADYLYAYTELNQIKPVWGYEKKLAKTEILHIKRIDSVDSIKESIMECKSDLDRFNADLRTEDEILSDAIEHFFPHHILLNHPNDTLDITFIPTHKGIFLIGTANREIAWIKENALCTNILNPNLYNCIGKWEKYDYFPPKHTSDTYFHQLLEYLIFCIRENIEDYKREYLLQNPDIADIADIADITNDVLSIYHKGESLFKLICSMK